MRAKPVIDKELRQIVDLHVLAFPGFFMTMLGPRFLLVYYRTILAYDGGIILVTRGTDGRPTGFVAGFVDPARFYQLLSLRKVAFGLAAALHIVWRPWLWRRLRASASHASSVATQTSLVRSSELASIAVPPQSTGQGIGRELARAFIERSRELGATNVYLTTEAIGNDRVNGFYRKLGFSVIDTFEKSRGRLMNVFSIKLT